MSQSLFEELQAIQNENIALYQQLSNLKKQKSKQDTPADQTENDESNIQLKNQIESIQAQQKHEEANRAAAKKNLQEVTKKLQQLQKEVDERNNIIRNKLLPQMKEEEEKTDQYYKEIIEKYRNDPSVDIERLQNLISQIKQKSLEAFQSQEEIEKLTRLISINQISPSDNSDESNINSLDIPYNQENPIPYLSHEPQSLDAARTKRRVSFKLESS
ncbi:hypothetical protein TRFO_03337 [Tritrichomonas foetus]|uniref:Uncharacterized protein n=1 Tax=Tritrichomonas foetus TaxID=1144522 RepID=A0A1J4KRM1_9EUKA|nr:hypothetical protein TRFO_03337 [Tritrichomonas foetus]|eukprot:OHT13576.1 hypothetical protein TRFO_03337 [Tritrichomonas foetus]